MSLNYLIFKNGIYDLTIDTFLHGTPSNVFIPYDYQPNYSPHLFAIHKFLSEIQPNDKEREDLLLSLASFLKPSKKSMFIWVGEGNGGKSSLYHLLCASLGHYIANFDETQHIIPIPATLKDKKIVYMPHDSEREIQAEVMKQLCEDTNHFQTVFECNGKPKIDGADEKFNSICREIKFSTKFIDNPTQLDERQRDIEVKNKIDNWGPDFMLLLLEYYRKYKELITG